MSNRKKKQEPKQPPIYRATEALMRWAIPIVGCVVKRGYVYLSNRTVHGLHEALVMMQAVCLEIVSGGVDAERLKRLEHCVSSVNSYLGFTIHCDAYNIRRQAFAKLDATFW